MTNLLNEGFLTPIDHTLEFGENIMKDTSDDFSDSESDSDMESETSADDNDDDDDKGKSMNCGYDV